jgi:hypothetical protein
MKNSVLIVIATILLTACTNKPNITKEEANYSPLEEKADLQSTITTKGTIVLKRGELDCTVLEVSTDSVDKALLIAAYLFNNPEFQDSIAKLSFTWDNYCNACGRGEIDATKSISGKTVLDSIFRRAEEVLNLEIVRGPLVGSSLGRTCPNTNQIKSYYRGIMRNMGHELPFSYAYAVHLCHEYTHNVGYCHTDNGPGDVAESVGEIAYHFIKKWYDAGLIQQQIKITPTV